MHESVAAPDNKTTSKLFHNICGINTVSAPNGFDLILDLRGRLVLTERRPEASSYIMSFEDWRVRQGKMMIC